MKFVGRAHGPHTIICRPFDDDLVADVAEATEVYADVAEFISAAAGLAAGTRSRAENAEVPAVRPSARGAVRRTELPAARRGGGPSDPGVSRLFGRWTPSLVAGDIPVPVPSGEPGLDWEVELAVVVSRPLDRVDAAAALGGVFGYAAFNDLSAREHQMHSRLRTLGKNADRSGPISPIVTADEVGDPADGLRLVSRINGEVVQDGNTADMIFPVGDILAYVSEVLTLAPGDVICTETPAGVGFKRTPPRYLGPGDVVEVEIERVGFVGNPIVETLSI